MSWKVSVGFYPSLCVCVRAMYVHYHYPTSYMSNLDPPIFPSPIPHGTVHRDAQLLPDLHRRAALALREDAAEIAEAGGAQGRAHGTAPGNHIPENNLMNIYI